MSEPDRSSTQTPFEPAFDSEGRRRGQALAAAVAGAGNPSGLHALSAYVASRYAAGTPRPQQADTRGLDRALPGDMSGLIDSLLGAGARNRGIVFGDTNHLNHGIGEALAGPKAIAALHRSGVTHVFLELPPDMVEALRRDRPPGSQAAAHPLTDWVGLRQSPYFDLVRRAENAGMTVVGMDINGPVSQQFGDLIRRRAAAQDDNERQAINRQIADLRGAFMAERLRITNQVWVPRIVETMRRSGRGRFVVLAGVGHTDNMVDVGQPDIHHADLDETLAERLAAPVPLVRLVEDPRASRARLVRGGDSVGQDNSEATLYVPPRTRQLVQRSPLFGAPLETRTAAENSLNRYFSAYRGMLRLRIASLGERAPGDDDYQAFRGLDEAWRRGLNGHGREACQSLDQAERVLRRVFPDGRTRRGERARDFIQQMRTEIDALERLWGPQRRPASPRGSVSALPAQQGVDISLASGPFSPSLPNLAARGPAARTRFTRG